MKIEKSLYVMCKDYMKTVERSKTWWGRLFNSNAREELCYLGLCATMSKYKIRPIFVHYGYKDVVYPFGGYDVYHKEQRSCTMHKNPERLAFVKRIIEDYEKQEDMV